MPQEKRERAAPEARSPLVRQAPWGELFEWQLPKLMAASGFRFATQFHEAIKREGIDLSYSHVARLTQKAPERMTVDVQFVLCRILNCSADALWASVGQSASANDAPDVREKLKAMKPVRARGLD